MVYLIYSCFESSGISAGTKITGSILLDQAETEADAQEKMAMYQERSAEFYRQYPALDIDTRWHTCIYWPNPLL